MTFLIDTHILLWYMAGDTRLPQRNIREIENSGNSILISSISLLEIAIKVSTGKLKITMPIIEFEKYLEKRSIAQINPNFRDLATLINLPFYHNDPFDRLIISQAISRDCAVMTDDKKFPLYPVQLL